MLFRPMGQRTFARAAQLLVSRGKTLADAVARLASADLFLQNEKWQYILWDPISATMIVNKVLMAEAQLLRLTGNPLRTKASGIKLDSLLASKLQ